MSATRIYILAKKLGVKSTAIVKKCQDEGLDVKNHMSAISAGLAATIEEWFSEGENVTTVETADKVDLKKVRIKKKPRRKKAPEKTGPEEKAAKKPTEETAVQITEEKATEPAEAERQESAAEQTTFAEPEAVPSEPEPIIPAGPILEKPEPAKLSGPKVVRVEAPEPLPRRRPRTTPRYDKPVTEPLIPESQKLAEPAVIDEATSTKTKRRPTSHHKERTHGRRQHDVWDLEAERKTKFSLERRQRDIEERQARLIAAGGEGARNRPTRKIATRRAVTTLKPLRPIKASITEPITVKSLSAALGVKSTGIISKLMEHGVMSNINQMISTETAELLCLDLGTELVVEHRVAAEKQIRDEFEHRERKNVTRKPIVVTMLGHVDHGKTSLLDKIRSTQVTASEAGGITQHMGAYQVNVGNSRITFLDTPGHEAFTAMRARGANMTDIVVLVIAADDGVMPQTVEAINHANAANVPIIVALNKIDLPGIDINRIYSQLAEYNLNPVEWGGQTDVVKTSAITGEGINDLLEHLDYTAELLELKADDTIPATGWVVEAKLSATQGPVATLLLKEGRLNKGDIVLAGCVYGRIKTLKDDHGEDIKVATSSMPVEVTGLSDVPQAGDRFYCLNDINRAKSVAEENKELSREYSLAKRTQVTLDNLFSQIEAGNIKELNIIIRADVQGSVDVLTKYLSQLSTDEVKVKILHSSTGGITEGDVVLAEASNAIIIGFNVVSDERVAKIAEEKGVDIRLYSVIYRITEDLEKSMVGLLEPTEEEKTLGRAVVRQLFRISKLGTVAGCYISDGTVRKNAKVRLIRDNIVIRDDLNIETLKHFKDDTREVKAGQECGIKIAKFDDVKIDDVLDFYTIVKVARTL